MTRFKFDDDRKLPQREPVRYTGNRGYRTGQIQDSEHSLKEYIYLLMQVPLHEYETQPYALLLNTDMCSTVTLPATARRMPKSIFCVCTLQLAARSIHCFS